MFRASSAHLQEDIVVYKQHMLPSLSIRVPGGLSLRSYLHIDRPPGLIESGGTICCLYTTMSSWRWVLDARNMQRRVVFYE